ncbi:MAG: hypothetical protein WCL34_08305 [Methylococcaceae bacterium]
MTTNVFDINARHMATDSRWSIDSSEFVLYIDDTGFDKICIAKGHAFMFAGNGKLIEQWKNWIAQNPSNTPKPPLEQDDSAISMCIANIETAAIRFEYRQDISLPLARFAGSGAKFARDCWLVNNNAQLAVNSAKQKDWFSGGTVAFFDFCSRQHNLLNSISIKEVQTQLLGGFVMYKNTGQPIPAREAAERDPEVKALLDKVVQGQVTVSAPFEFMHTPWTEREKAELYSVLDDIFA